MLAAVARDAARPRARPATPLQNAYCIKGESPHEPGRRDRALAHRHGHHHDVDLGNGVIYWKPVGYPDERGGICLDGTTLESSRCTFCPSTRAAGPRATTSARSARPRRSRPPPTTAACARVRDEQPVVRLEGKAGVANSTTWCRGATPRGTSTTSASLTAASRTRTSSLLHARRQSRAARPPEPRPRAPPRAWLPAPPRFVPRRRPHRPIHRAHRPCAGPHRSSRPSSPR